MSSWRRACARLSIPRPLGNGLSVSSLRGHGIESCHHRQQSVRKGLQHVTFSIDWMRVTSACDAEPLSSALLARMNLASRRPAKMNLVVMYRAENNRLTNIWVEVPARGATKH